MIRLVTIGGTGDTYMVCALYAAFCAAHKRMDVQVVVKAQYAPIVEMFDVPYAVNDALVANAERDFNFQLIYENILLAPDTTFYVHPCFVRSGTRVDKLTTHPDASQADMYRMILRVPMDAPLTQPMVPYVDVVPGTLLFLPTAVSWPNMQPEFWTKLAPALESAGWTLVRNEPTWTLRELFMAAASAEWVIGPQCGVISILCTGQFPCRKTVATPSVDGTIRPDFLPNETYPYAYVTKYSNTDYDVEEFKITDTNHAQLIDTIVNSVNGLGLWPHNPEPTLRIKMLLTPGDFLDRLAVLTVKRTRFLAAKRAAIEREYCEHVEQRRLTTFPDGVDALFEGLVKVHELSFDVLERLVPAALGQDAFDAEAHIVAIDLNKQRVRLKQNIDALCHAPFTEVKDYYTSKDDEQMRVFAQARQARVAAKLSSRAQTVLTHHTQTPVVLRHNFAPTPVLLEEKASHNLVAYRERVYVIPQRLGPIQLENEVHRQQGGIRNFDTVAEARSYCLKV